VNEPNHLVKGAIRLGVGLLFTWLSHLVWQARTAKDVALRWLAATFCAHLILNQFGV
jgi:hypothetical protein